MSDLQRDIDIMEIERLVYATGMREHAEAWQRIRARLTPDRELIADAIATVFRDGAGPDGRPFALAAADAAIAAMGEP